MHLGLLLFQSLTTLDISRFCSPTIDSSRSNNQSQTIIGTPLYQRSLQYQTSSKSISISHKTSMHATTILLAGLTALATASPIQSAKADAVSAPFATGTGSPQGGSAAPSGVPMPVAVPVPRPVGSAPCPIDGKLVCNGPEQWGLCNWGEVKFQRVAAGTQCLDGEIVFGPGFGGH